MKIPLKQDHVKGKFQVAFFMRDEEGTAVEFSSTVPLDKDSPIVKAAIGLLESVFSTGERP